MFSNPDKNVASLLLQDGMQVADFGAGSGKYTLACSSRVGQTGKVYAVEVQKDILKKLESELKQSKISNVLCIWGDVEKKDGTKIVDHTVDVVIMANILFQVDDKVGLIEEAKRILKRGGRVLLVDWSDSLSGIGPESKYIIDEKTAEELFAKRGFKFVEKIVTNEHHYGIIFRYE